MSDFHERLRLKKQQILGEKPSVEVVDTVLSKYDSMFIDASELMSKVLKVLGIATVGAAIFALIVCCFIITDWWTFIGTPEYHEWKERVERAR